MATRILCFMALASYDIHQICSENTSSPVPVTTTPDFYELVSSTIAVTTTRPKTSPKFQSSTAKAGRVLWNIPYKFIPSTTTTTHPTTDHQLKTTAHLVITKSPNRNETTHAKQPKSDLTSTFRRQRSVEPTTADDRQDDFMLVNQRSDKSKLSSDDHVFVSVNGSCSYLDASAQTTNDFAAAFEQELKTRVHNFVEENGTFDCRTWEIRCGPNLILNFTMTNLPVNVYQFKHLLLGHPQFSFIWNDETYLITGFSQFYSDMVPPNTDHEMARLQVGPATGHFYQGFIYIIIGIVIAVAVLVLATVCLVRLHRRQGRHLSMQSGECTPTRTTQDVSDYTLTRIPRTTKLFMDDIERTRLGWGYTNPDYQADNPSKSESKSPGQLRFMNTGLLPRLNQLARTTDKPVATADTSTQGRSSPYGSQQTDTTSSGNAPTKSFSSTSPRKLRSTRETDPDTEVKGPFSVRDEMKYFGSLPRSAGVQQDVTISPDISTHI